VSFDYDAYLDRQLHSYLDALDRCPYCGDYYDEDDIENNVEHVCDIDEPDPDRFRDEDPNDREDY
jgi:hypothetical protein